MFQNTNNRIIKKLSKASIKATRLRNIFVIFTIALATCMIVVISLYLIGARQQAKNDAYGRYQAALVNIDENVIENLRSKEEIDAIGVTYFFDTLHIADYKLTVMYMDDMSMQLSKYPDLEGRLPELQNEIVVTTNYLAHRESSAGIGDKIPLAIGDREFEYTICGILPFSSTGRDFMIIASKALVLSLDEHPLYSAYIRLYNSDDMFSDELKSEISSIASNVGISRNSIVYSTYYFYLMEQQITQDISTIIGVFVLVALACALVVYNLFYISVIGKTNEYGRMRIIGTTKRQIMKIVTRESLYLSSLAIPPGMILGSIIGYLLVPDGWNTGTSIVICFIVSIFIYLIVIIATHKPVKLAAKVTPLEALRHISYANSVKASATKKLRRSINPYRLAFINLTRNKKKAILTVSSLGVCGILFMSSSAYLHSIDYESMARKEFPYGEIKIELGIGGPVSHNSKEYLELQKNNFLDDSLLDSIRLIDGVENIKVYSGLFIDTTLPSGYTEPFNLDGYTKDDLDLLTGKLLEGTADYEKLAENNGVVVNGMNEWKMLFGWTPQLGDKLYVETPDGKTSELLVMGIVSTTTYYGGNEHIYIPDLVLPKLQNSISNFCYQAVISTSEEKTDFVEQEIYRLISTIPDLGIHTLKDSAAKYRDSLNSQKAPIYIITIFIGIFGIVNLLNTLITNILVRKTELSVFQTLGLDHRQLSKMLLSEGLAYSFGTAIITLTLGTACGYFLCNIFNTIGVFGTVTYVFPVEIISVYLVFLLSLQIIFSYASIKLFKQQPLVERIKGVS